LNESKKVGLKNRDDDLPGKIINNKKDWAALPFQPYTNEVKVVTKEERKYERYPKFQNLGSDQTKTKKLITEIGKGVNEKNRKFITTERDGTIRESNSAEMNFMKRKRSFMSYTHMKGLGGKKKRKYLISKRTNPPIY
jgi:hypothetical protein